MKIAAVTSYGPTLANVRGPLLRAMVRAGHEVVASAPDCSPAVVSELCQMGIRHYRLPLSRRGLNPISDILYFLRVVRFLRNESVDVCFLYTIKPVIFGSVAARLAGIRQIYSLITGLGYSFMGSTPATRFLTLVAKLFYRAALRLNRWVFFQNSDDRDLFVTGGLVRDRASSVVNGSGVDLDYYSPKPFPEGPPLFLMIARRLRAKGIIEFIEAARRLKGRFPECVFRLISRSESGPDAVPRGLVQEAVESGILECVEEVSDVRDELRNCSVYVLPSYREGIPRSVLEAMACGRPIITTDTPGCRETVVEGVNGFMVPIKDVDALEQILVRFISDRNLAARMGPESRRIAEEKYDVHLVNHAMLTQMGLAPS